MLDPSLLALLRLVSPALPVGAFAYSQGLEGAVEQGFVSNEDQTMEWVSGILQQNITKLDLPALYWQMTSLQENNINEFCAYNQIIFAHRETAEFRLESNQLGLALLRLLRDTNATNGEMTAELLKPTTLKPIDWVSAFAIAAHCYDIEPDKALLGFAWAWSETQVAAAVKLVPLGQTQGQRMLVQLSDVIAQLVPDLMKALSNKTAEQKQVIGAISPNLTIVSCQHETQYSRLFRS